MEEIEIYENNDTTPDRYRLSVIITAACMALLGIYAIYSVFTSGIEWGFDTDWNCLKSPIFPVFAFIGFFLQFFNWQHFSQTTWIGTKKSGESKVKWEKSYDVTDVVFGSIVIPLLTHLIIVPCIYGAILWYLIIGALHLLGKISPFLISALIAAIVFMFYCIGCNVSTNRYRVAIFVALSLVEAGILGGTAYFMNNHDNISIFSNLSSGPTLSDPIGTCTVTGNGVNLRVGPGTSFDKSGNTVSSGESYPLLEESGGWVKIDYYGNPLWMSDKFCALSYKNNGDENAIYEEDDMGCWRGDEDEGTATVQTGNDNPNDVGVSLPEPSVEVANPIPGAIALAGKLDGKYEIVLQYLQEEDGKVSGTYYYTKYKTPIRISGEVNGDTMTLEEYTGENLTGRFIGTISTNSFDGVWQSADGSKAMDCTLYRVN